MVNVTKENATVMRDSQEKNVRRNLVLTIVRVTVNVSIQEHANVMRVTQEKTVRISLVRTTVQAMEYALTPNVYVFQDSQDQNARNKSVRITVLITVYVFQTDYVNVKQDSEEKIAVRENANSTALIMDYATLLLENVNVTTNSKENTVRIEFA